MKCKKAVVLLSGGIDSTVCLALAQSQDFQCFALSIDYQQRNNCELQYAAKIAKKLNVHQHRICTIAIGGWGGSALTDPELKLQNSTDNNIPNTYVPARNTIFLATALGWAEAIGAHDIFIGVNRLDYDHYPDCRPEYFTAFAIMANLATRDGVEGYPFKIHTPLIAKDKCEIILQGIQLKIDFSLTFSCYDPDENNNPCHQCNACELRRIGFQQISRD